MVYSSVRSKLPSVPWHLSRAEAGGWATKKRLACIYLLPCTGLSERPFPSSSWTEPAAVEMDGKVQPMKQMCCLANPKLHSDTKSLHLTDCSAVAPYLSLYLP